MKNYLKISTIFSLMSLALILAIPAQAQRSQPCSNENREQPSQRRREITNEEYGLRFEIPANYRTELQRETGSRQRLSILVRNPADVEFLDCATRNRMIGAGHQVSDVMVTIEPRPRNIRSVRDILEEASEVRGIEITESGFTTISGRDAVFYTAQTLYPYRHRNVKLIHPNGQDIIRIQAGDYGEEIDPIDVNVMNTIVSSFSISR